MSVGSAAHIVSTAREHDRFLFSILGCQYFYFDRPKLPIIGYVHRSKTKLVTRAQVIDYDAEPGVDFLLIGAHDLATRPFHEIVDALAQLSKRHDLKNLSKSGLHD